VVKILNLTLLSGKYRNPWATEGESIFPLLLACLTKWLYFRNIFFFYKYGGYISAC